MLQSVCPSYAPRAKMMHFRYMVNIEHLMGNHMLEVKSTGQCESGQNGLNLEKYALSVSP